MRKELAATQNDLLLSWSAVFTRGVPGRVPAGTNGTSRPFCPGAGTSRQMPKSAGTNGTKKDLWSIAATNYNTEVILFLSTLSVEYTFNIVAASTDETCFG